MEDKLVGYIRITNNNGTYLLNESTLPVYVSDEFHLYAVEEYEKGDPCQHWLDDLKSDGVEFVATITPAIHL